MLDRLAVDRYGTEAEGELHIERRRGRVTHHTRHQTVTVRTCLNNIIIFRMHMDNNQKYWWNQTEDTLMKHKYFVTTITFGLAQPCSDIFFCSQDDHGRLLCAAVHLWKGPHETSAYGELFSYNITTDVIKKHSLFRYNKSRRIIHLRENWTSLAPYETPIHS